MRVRYKHLVAGGVDQTSWADASLRRNDDQEASNWDEYDAPPRAVESHEGEGSLDEVRRFVRAGKLVGTDLVDVGGGWQTVEDVLELEEALASAPRRSTFPWKLLAAFALWATACVGLLASGLELCWSVSLMILLHGVALTVWHVRRDEVRLNDHRGVVPTVTRQPLPPPGEAEPGSLSISAPGPQAGSLSLEPIQDGGGALEGQEAAVGATADWRREH